VADNVRLSAGTNDGATIRSLATADGIEYGVSALAYATTISPGANVLLDVSTTNRLPVAATLTGTIVVDSIVGPVLCNNATPGDLQALAYLAEDQTLTTVTSITNPVTIVQGTASNLNATVQQGGSWTVAATQSGTWNVGTVSTVTAVTSITNPVAATQSGSWNVGVTGAVTVAQGTAANLLCTASQGGSWTVAATQSGTWNVGTVSTVTAVTGITNPVAVTQSGTWTVGLSATQTLANVTTVGTITNPVASTQSGTWTVGATQSGTWNVGTVTTLTGVTNPVVVAQSNAASLLATVNIASAQTLATVTTVGTVTSVTTVGTITNPVGVAAGTNLIGKASAGNDTSTIYNGTTALTPKFAKIVASSSGDNSIVALVSGKKIRVLRWGLASNGTVNVKFRSNTTDVTGPRYLTQFASAGGAYCPVGIFETAAGEALNLNLSAAVAVGGELVYCEV